MLRLFDEVVRTAKHQKGTAPPRRDDPRFHDLLRRMNLEP